VEVLYGVLLLGFDTCGQTETTETENGRILSNEVTVADYYCRSRTEVSDYHDRKILVGE
jgi:hypothetical protein